VLGLRFLGGRVGIASIVYLCDFFLLDCDCRLGFYGFVVFICIFVKL